MSTEHDFAANTLSQASLQEAHANLGVTLLQHPAKRIHHCLAIVASSFLHNQAETFQETCQQRTRAGTMGFKLFLISFCRALLQRLMIVAYNMMHAKAGATGHQSTQ